MSTILKTCPLAVALVVMASGCTVAPFDGQVLGNSPTNTIPAISGFSVGEGHDVVVWAKASDGSWEPVATTHSTSNSIRWNNARWWQWSVSNVNVPNRFWVDKNGGACGRKATLRTTIEGYDAYSIDQPILECFDSNMTSQQFLDACGSDNSPEFSVETCGTVCC